MQRRTDPLRCISGIITASGMKSPAFFPAAPNCHKSLPLYWYEADCFEAVAIIAQKAASKTTMIVSLLANQCSALRFLDEELQVLPAHDPQKDPFYKGLEEQSRLLEEARTFAGSGPCLTALLNGQGQESAAACRPGSSFRYPGGRLIMENPLSPPWPSTPSRADWNRGTNEGFKAGGR